MNQEENRQRLEAAIIAGLETQGNRIFSRKEIEQFVADAQNEYELPGIHCHLAVKTIVDWQGRRIAARAGN